MICIVSLGHYLMCIFIRYVYRLILYRVALCLFMYIIKLLCVYSCMYFIHVPIMHVCIDGWIDGCVHLCMSMSVSACIYVFKYSLMYQFIYVRCIASYLWEPRSQPERSRARLSLFLVAAGAYKISLEPPPSPQWRRPPHPLLHDSLETTQPHLKRGISSKHVKRGRRTYNFLHCQMNNPYKESNGSTNTGSNSLFLCLGLGPNL